MTLAVAIVGSIGCRTQLEDLVPPIPDLARTAVVERCTGLQPNAPWPMLGRCATHRGVAANIGPQTAAVRWVFPARVYGVAVGVGEIVYAGSDDHHLYAIDGTTGMQIWSFPTEGAIYSVPALAEDGTIYFSAGKGDAVANNIKDVRLYALNGGSGEQRWQHALGDAWTGSSPAVGPDGTIFAVAGDDHLWALRPDGTVKWRLAVDATNVSTPAITPDGLLFVGAGFRVFAVDAAQGTQRWVFTATDVIKSSPAVGEDGTVYVGCFDGNVFALDAQTGTERWRFATGDVVSAAAAIGPDGTIYIGPQRSLLALDPIEGKPRWAFPLGVGLGYAPVVGADGTVYGGGDGNERAHDLHAVDGPTGKERWRFATGLGLHAKAAMGGDGTLYVGGFDGKLYAIGPGP